MVLHHLHGEQRTELNRPPTRSAISIFIYRHSHRGGARYPHNNYGGNAYITPATYLMAQMFVLVDTVPHGSGDTSPATIFHLEPSPPQEIRHDYGDPVAH